MTLPPYLCGRTRLFAGSGLGLAGAGLASKASNDNRMRVLFSFHGADYSTSGCGVNKKNELFFGVQAVKQQILADVLLGGRQEFLSDDLAEDGLACACAGAVEDGLHHLDVVGGGCVEVEGDALRGS